MTEPLESHRRLHLARLLHAFQPGDATEADYRERMLGLLELDADCTARTHFAPGHFTASAFVLSPARDQLLLIHHAKLNRWLQPGGHIDAADRDVIAAAQREVAEETGLVCLEPPAQIFDLDIHEIPGRGTAPTHSHFDVRFLFVAPNLNHTAGSDALSARWSPLSAVSELESDESVLRAVRKLL